MARRAESGITGQGGPGRGQGRKAADGATGVVRVTVQMTPEQREEFHMNGGSPWVRKLIEENKMTRIAMNLDGVTVGDVLTVKGGEVFKGDEKVSFDLTKRVADDGEYTVAKTGGSAPADVSYYAQA